MLHFPSSHRTLLPLMYPPHSIALGSIYLSSLLLSFEQTSPPTRESEIGPAELANLLNQHLNWETKFKTKAEDLDGMEFQTNVYPHILICYLSRHCTYVPRPSHHLHPVIRLCQHFSIHAIITVTSSFKTTLPPSITPFSTTTPFAVPIQRRSAHPSKDFHAADGA